MAQEIKRDHFGFGPPRFKASLCSNYLVCSINSRLYIPSSLPSAAARFKPGEAERARETGKPGKQEEAQDNKREIDVNRRRRTFANVSRELQAARGLRIGLGAQESTCTKLPRSRGSQVRKS